MKNELLQIVQAAKGWNVVTWNYDPMRLWARAELEPIACWALVEHTEDEGECAGHRYRKVYPVTASGMLYGDEVWDENPDEIAGPGADVDKLHDNARRRMWTHIHGELHRAGWASNEEDNPRWTPPGGGAALASGDAFKTMVASRKAKAAPVAAV